MKGKIKGVLGGVIAGLGAGILLAHYPLVTIGALLWFLGRDISRGEL